MKSIQTLTKMILFVIGWKVEHIILVLSGVGHHINLAFINIIENLIPMTIVYSLMIPMRGIQSIIKNLLKKHILWFVILSSKLLNLLQETIWILLIR